MGEQHIVRERDSESDGEIEILNWVRKKTKDKTGLELAIPVHPELRRIIDATLSKHLTFSRHRVRRTVHGGRLRRLVPRSVQ
jgi:hypothetical protein